MKGIAPFVVLALAMLAVGSAAVIQLLYPPSLQPVPSQDNPVKIAQYAYDTAPWQQLLDWTISGFTGLAVWIANVLVRAISWLMSAVAQHDIVMPPVFGYIIVALITLTIIWKKKEWIYGQVTKYTIIAVVILVAVFIVGIVLKYMGLV